MMHSMLFFLILLFVQVVVESLPVSSSTHVLLVQKYLDSWCWNSGFFAENGAVSLEVVLHFMHLPTLFILLIFFRERLFFLCKALGRCWRVIAKIILLTACADVITVLFFIFFKLVPPSMPLGLGLCITAGILYASRYIVPGGAKWNWRSAFILGTVQGLALLPGVSRFAAVYVAACWLGLPQRKAFQITWLVQTPLILAACAKSAYILWSHDQLMPLMQPLSLAFTGIATLFGLLAFYGAAYMARTNKLWWFSFYMIVPIVAWFYLWYLK